MARFEVEADSRLEELIARIEAGDEVVVTRPGKPALRLTVEAAEITPVEAPGLGLSEPEQPAFEVELTAIPAATAKQPWRDPRLVDPATLTRDDERVARLLPNAERRQSRAAATEDERGARIAAIAAAASREARLGPDAARSQDFLYDDYGLPA